MMMKKNKGVSMPEVLIALAVFMVMMIPLVSSLISGIKTTNSSKETQGRDDYARNLMENIKEMPMTVLDTADTDYFTKKGSQNVTITANPVNTTTYHVTKLNGVNAACPFDSYEVYGNAYFGVDHKKYSYLIDVSNEAYAQAESSGSSNPNHADYGFVESLDQSKVALISATMSNYDSAAYDVILSKKMTDLRIQHDKKQAEELAADPLYEKELFDVKTEVDKFKNDKGSRQIRVSVTGSKSAGYEVKCTLYYRDSCGLASSETGKSLSTLIGTIEYVPYVKKFKTLPNIYLMYNVGVYNNKYMDDFIVCDLDGLADESAPVNIFVVETAETFSSDTASLINSSSGYSAKLKEANSRVSSGNVLYKKTDEDRNAVNAMGNQKVGIYLCVRKQGMNEAKRKRLHIYHNLGVPDGSAYNNDANGTAAHANAVSDWNTHKKNEKITSLGGNTVDNLFGGGTAGGDCEVPSSVSVMDRALQDIRDLYTVKIYMREGDVDAATLRLSDPVLKGSKGGGAIE